MPHADVYQLSYRNGAAINRAGQLGLLTDTGVANADSLAGLSSFVNGVAALHADQQNYKPRIVLAWQGNAALTDSAVSGLTTVSQLSALTAIGSNTTNLGLAQDD